MKNLTLNLEEEISILSKYGITPNELMLIRTLLILQDEGNEELFKSYIESLYVSNIKLRDVIVNLQEKGIILKQFKIGKEGTPFDPYSIPFNKSFISTLYKCSFELGKELFNSYPEFTTINGNVVYLKTVAKHFDSLEDSYFRYGRIIKWNIDRHKEIIDLVEWAKDKDLISCSLSSFIINNGWLGLEAIKNGDRCNINFNAVKLI